MHTSGEDEFFLARPFFSPHKKRNIAIMALLKGARGPGDGKPRGEGGSQRGRGGGGRGQLSARGGTSKGGGGRGSSRGRGRGDTRKNFCLKHSWRRSISSMTFSQCPLLHEPDHYFVKRMDALCMVRKYTATSQIFLQTVYPAVCGCQQRVLATLRFSRVKDLAPCVLD